MLSSASSFFQAFESRKHIFARTAHEKHVVDSLCQSRDAREAGRPGGVEESVDRVRQRGVRSHRPHRRAQRREEAHQLLFEHTEISRRKQGGKRKEKENKTAGVARTVVAFMSNSYAPSQSKERPPTCRAATIAVISLIARAVASSSSRKANISTPVVAGWATDSTSRTPAALHSSRICAKADVAFVSEISHCEREGAELMPAWRRDPLG